MQEVFKPIRSPCHSCQNSSQLQGRRKCSFMDKEVHFGEYIAATVGMFVHHHIPTVSMLHAKFLARYWGCTDDCFCPHLQGACRFKS